jgi:hypothetical protein
VLWNESWINLLMQQADAVRYINGKRPAPVIESKEDLDRILGRRKTEDGGQKLEGEP